MKIFVVNENDAGQRINKFFEKLSFRLPKSLIYKSIRKKNIKLNKKRCKADSFLNAGDIISVYGLDDFFKESCKNHLKLEYVNSEKDLPVVYEDDNLLILNKPSGLKSHPDRHFEDSLIGRVVAYLKNRGLYLETLENSFRPALCNRLDRNTSGLVIAAKTAIALRETNRLIRENKILKIYCCWVEGTFNKKTDTIVGWWKKNKTLKKALVAFNERKGFSKIVTRYEVLDSTENSTKLKVTIASGKYHQIRAHLASIGHPIVGDVKYGGIFSKLGQKLISCGLLFKTKNSFLNYLDGKYISISDEINYKNID